MAEEVYAALVVRERPRLCPLTQPFDADIKERIDALAATKAVRAALHLLNDDLYAAHELVHPRPDYKPDRTSKLVHAIMHRREKNYLEAERYWKLVDHPLLEELYDDHGGPIALQRLMEKVDGKRVGEVKRGPLEDVQFDELKRVARWAIDHVDSEEL
ncbi:hypothetical protein EXIGLDRAFT_727036 [Exidia glandulosa HHB12029]|uniref:Uncharacterized protein n=1 Tax=Exidia glandulosa HHB12029 TaxID=1314781 RepID=A0A165DHI5_EXIGL|nr:hypothetical protein EXIGLDRAFT_727036 [Exidia glandulosa HHB12029]